MKSKPSVLTVREGIPQRPPRKKRTYWREYVAISPFYLLFIGFAFIPLIYSVYLATLSWNGLGEPVQVGLDQIKRVLFDGEFLLALKNTVTIFLMGQIPVVVGSLIGAIILSHPKLRGKGFYQTLFFLPQVTSIVAIAVIFQSLFSDKYGFVNKFLGMLGIDGVPWLTSPFGVKVVIAFMIIWHSFGYFLVIFLSGISSIDYHLYEAAELDGAGAMRSFWSITLPMLRPTILFVTITGSISGLQLFAQPQVLLNSGTGPGNSGLTMMYMQVIYMGGSGATGTAPDIGYAAAIGWGIFLVIAMLALLNSRFLKTGQE